MDIYYDKKSNESVDSLPLISIVVPVYNIEAYLPECVESILAQTYKNIEVILVDDGSQDRSSTICDFYKDQDRRVRVLHKQNGGLSSARKAGARLANGMYILQIDGDDWVDSDYVENMSKPLCGNCPDMVVNLSMYKFYKDGRSHERVTPFERGLYRNEEIVSQLYPHLVNDDCFWETDLPMSVWSYLYRRDFFMTVYEIVSDEIAMGEDNLVTFLAFLKTDSVYVINNPGYHYRQREGSICHVVKKSYFNESRLIYEVLCREVNQLNDSSKTIPMRRKIPRIIFELLFLGAMDKVLAISNEFFFPYPMVRNGGRIFVYGMGVVGQGMIRAITMSSRFYLVGCSDQGWQSFSKTVCISGSDCKVYAPDDITEADFDYLIIAVSRANLRKEIELDLVRRGIAIEKIAHIDESLLIEDNLPF